MEKNMEQVLQKASVLVEALPYIQKFNRKIIVVKYGGSAMSNEEMQRKVIEDVVLLKLVGFKPIIVHGGGKSISNWVKKTGKEAEFYKGLRITDGETMEIAEMVLNRINKSLVAMAEQLGVRAIGISGKDGKLLNVDKRLGTEKISALSVISRRWIPKFFMICWRWISFPLWHPSVRMTNTIPTTSMRMTRPAKSQRRSVRRSWHFLRILKDCIVI